MAIDAVAARIPHYTRAIEYFEKAGERSHAQQARVLLATAYTSRGWHRVAEDILVDVESTERLFGNVGTAVEAQQSLGLNCYDSREFARGADLLGDAARRFRVLDKIDSSLFCWRMQAECLTQTGDHEAAAAVLERAITHAELVADRQYRAKLTTDLAYALIGAGRPTEASRAIVDAASRHIELEQHEDAANVMAMFFTVGHATGDLDDSAAVVSAAREIYRSIDGYGLAFCDLQLAVLYMSMGQADRAAASIADATAGVEALLTAAQGTHDTLDEDLAGNVYSVAARLALQRGDLDAAQDAVLRLSQRAGPNSSERLPNLLATRAEIALAQGDLDAAGALAQRALDVIDAAPEPTDRSTLFAGSALPIGFAVVEGICRQILGGIAAQQRDWSTAMVNYRQARDRAAALGQTQRAALLDTMEASAMFGRWWFDPSARSDTDILQRLLDLLIPAYIFLDDLRLQFPSAGVRRAYRDSCERILVFAMGVVTMTEMHTLTAELVETIINSGVHSATPGRREDDQITTLLGHVPSAEPAAVPIDMPAVIAVDEAYPAMTLGLIASPASKSRLTADLPMKPSPPLLMPDGRIALKRYRDIRAERFPLRHDPNDNVCTTC
ncbi:hypothetical protein [Mycolicibacterium llatzerense]|uniref:hypothetical protein n=1 Tax=Mycolicibacterium llatzerense TaxID=280871 RepID=UPI0008DD67AE|nr:hypothetical protein [Mycolicibacterium llatzerense]